jgi:hypothetical protein
MKLRLVYQGKQMHLTSILLWTFLRLPETLALPGGLHCVKLAGNSAQTRLLDVLRPTFPEQTGYLYSTIRSKLRSEPQLGKRAVIRKFTYIS